MIELTDEKVTEHLERILGPGWHVPTDEARTDLRARARAALLATGAFRAPTPPRTAGERIVAEFREFGTAPGDMTLAIDKEVAKAVAAEREACALVFTRTYPDPYTPEGRAASRIATAFRARNDNP